MRHPRYASLLVAVGLFVLVGVASATRPPETSDVSAAFTTTQVRSHSRTCTEGNNSFRVTNAVWRGTSTSSEPRLAGTVVIATHAVLNETTGDGWLSGSWRSSNQSANPKTTARSNASLSAVIDNLNHLDGLASGEAHNPGARLLGNWSATIVGDTLSGELGAIAPVTPDNSALLYRGGC